ncbi:MAG: acyl-CoA thioesterase [Paramuribaculum sp.]|nr:acyl-CoA thioesterase [Paramuribaculum sp.]
MDKPLNYLPSSNPRVPQAKHPFRHCLKVQTRFSDIDMLGHLNNNAYLSIMDLAKIKYLTDTAPEQSRHNLEIKAVVVHIDCDFYSPAYFDEPLEVWTTIGQCSERSFTIEQRMINSQTGETKCITHTVLAGFDPKLRKGIPLDTEWINNLQEWEERPILTTSTATSGI